ncbi:MAG TPA: NUDIX hydrolase [Iamia sp.]|nr:NUDIX hydrolase [Iamia sp.]
MAEGDGSGFHHLGDEVVAEMQRLRIVTARFAAPDGQEFTRDTVRNMGVVAIVPLLDDGRTVLLVRQYRGPIDSLLLELPAGLRDVEGEAPEACARRELVEEVGRTAADLSVLATMHPAAGFSDQVVTIYLATGLAEVPLDRQGPEEQHMTVEELALHDVPALIAAGTLTDAKTMVGLLAAREHLGLR